MTTFNIGHFVPQNARRLPDGLAVVTASRSRSWREVNDRIDRLANGLKSAGIKSADRVQVQARNSAEAFEVKWACFKLGAVWVPINFRLTPSEVKQIAQDCQPAAIFYDIEFKTHSDAAAQACTEHVDPLRICIDAPDEPSSCAQLIANARADFEEAAVDRDHPAWLFYTSGTTGRSKGAVLTHGQLAFVVASHLADMFPGTSETDVSLVLAPLSHGAGVHALAHVARAAPQVIYTDAKFDPAEVWRLVQEHRITNFFAVPSMIKTLVEHPAVDLHDHTSLRHVNYGGAPMFRAEQKLALEKLGPVLVQHYGLGEFTANITVLTPAQHMILDSTEKTGPRSGSCGSARTGIEVGIFDQQGRRVQANETGEICARGQAVFAGYYRNPSATEKAFRNGWFRTGDLGYVDDHGFVYINGRVSDMYISGGLNVYPREAEEILLEDCRISEVAIVGVPHPKWGECGAAVIVCRQGHDVSAAEILSLLDGRLARYKLPHHIHFWQSLPKSAYGKTLKREILASLQASQAAPPDLPA